MKHLLSIPNMSVKIRYYSRSQTLLNLFKLIALCKGTTNWSQQHSLSTAKHNQVGNKSAAHVSVRNRIF